MSEPHDPPSGGESGAAPPEQSARRRGLEAWGQGAIGLGGALILVVVLVATGPLWAPLLPWATRNEPAPDANTTRVEAPPNAALQGLERRVAVLEAKPAAPPSDLAEIRQEVAKLAGSVADLAARVEAVRSQTVGDPTDIALVLALLQIRYAVEAGRPFAAAYEALVALVQARPEIAAATAPLAEPATAGLPGRPVLANRLRELSDAIATADASTDTNAAVPDWADQAWRRLSGLVTIRRIDGAGPGRPGGGPADAVKAAQSALAGGDLEGAVGALDGLTGAPAEIARPWLRMAKERLAAEAALQKIEALLVARLGAPGSGLPR